MSKFLSIFKKQKDSKQNESVQQTPQKIDKIPRMINQTSMTSDGRSQSDDYMSFGANP